MQSNKPELVWVKSLQGLFAEDGNQAGGANLAGGTGDAGGREGRRTEPGTQDVSWGLWPAWVGRHAAGRPGPAPHPSEKEGRQKQALPLPSTSRGPQIEDRYLSNAKGKNKG